VGKRENRKVESGFEVFDDFLGENVGIERLMVRRKRLPAPFHEPNRISSTNSSIGQEDNRGGGEETWLWHRVAMIPLNESDVR